MSVIYNSDMRFHRSIIISLIFEKTHFPRLINYGNILLKISNNIHIREKNVTFNTFFFYAL